MDVKNYNLKELSSLTNLSVFSLDNQQQSWPRDKSKDVDSLFKPEVSQTPYKLKFRYDLKTGKPCDIYETVSAEADRTNRNSLSLQRAPGPPDEAVRGSVRNMPFMPGGMELADLSKESRTVSLDFDKLLTTPPGFDSGMDFKKADSAAEIAKASLAPVAEKQVKNEPCVVQAQDGLPEVDIADIVRPLRAEKLHSTLWAEVIDVTKPLDNFSELVPNPAFSWKFELDTFQKQAIVRLERSESVFIAAHTSAGKTVVAEYAIALSQKHMTRTIYTSPIKALSNQKFRDFRNTFQDVGLLTGDVQINPKATCLIMTTEILRSMLYNGSDLIRDLEWVIFDEVHYINDAERGVVWEEVLILLPEHVGIVMLSATVPNTLEFASWVGMTKKRKMYVISTPKRPVPLEHYLYVGPSGKSKDCKFLILGADGKFIQKGYLDAVDAKKPKEKVIQPPQGGKGSDQRGRGGGPTRGGGRGQDQGGRGRGGQGTRATAVIPHTPVWGPQQEKNLWIGVVNHLSSEEKLPVVAFTLSRNRCDTNAEMLTSVDLTTAKEKGAITQFLHKCLDKLKGSDRRLPQVTQMSELLKRGIGIHHSGILPILKEIVEMLFQDGKVKLLFATETFAMGVNMPARTVVFDDIRKHDGKSRRTLNPAEYIQMAGRAGRRGLDLTGTVIILCKTGVPELTELQSMMLGKPQRLESQFRVTYSMILNLLRVKRLRIEDMMKRSFGELHSRTKVAEYEEKLQEMRDEVDALPKLECSECEDIEEFYNVARQYLEVRKEVYGTISTHPQMVKELAPGRVLVVSDENSLKLGLLLVVDTRSKERRYSVLVLCDNTVMKNLTSAKKLSVETDRNNKFSQMLGFRNGRSYFIPETVNSRVVTLKCDGIVDVTKASIKGDVGSVLRDWENRQIPRFSDDPPNASYKQAVEELLNLTANPNFDTLNLVEDLRLRDMELVLRCQRLEQLRSRLNSFSCYGCSCFEGHFGLIFSNMQVREEYMNLKYLTSDESLMNSPEYAARLDVLKALGYVNSEGTVELKGQVACEIGNHELMVTELVFDNVLTDLKEEDIAALLSSLVFQQKSQVEPELTAVQTAGIEQIKEIARRIGQTQQQCGLKEAVGDYIDQFQFGLVEVVHKWALGVPFYEIIELTDVQEGLIVRTIQRLDETIRDVRDAARIVGDPILQSKMETASAKIKRDIVFQASLYLQ